MSAASNLLLIARRYDEVIIIIGITNTILHSFEVFSPT